MLKNNKQLFVYPPMMALAFYSTLLGYAVPQIREFYGLTYAQVGLFQTLQGVGMAVSLILCFCIFSAFNSVKISALHMALFAALMVLFGINKNLAVVYALFFLIGLMINSIDTLSNTVIKDTAKKNTSFYIGLMHGLWALAGALGPFLARAVGKSFEAAFIWLGVFTAATVALFIYGLRANVRLPMLQKKHNFGGLLKLFRMLKVKGMPSLALTNTFSCLVQNTYILFIASYVKERFGFPLGEAISLSALFLGLLIGRTVFSVFSERMKVMRTMVIVNSLAVACFAGMLLTNSFAVLAVLICLGSTFTGMNFPALILESHRLVPNDVSAASSLIYAGLVIALLAAPPIVGWIGDTLSLKTALLITVAGLIPVIIIAGLSVKRFDAQKV